MNKADYFKEEFKMEFQRDRAALYAECQGAPGVQGKLEIDIQNKIAG